MIKHVKPCIYYYLFWEIFWSDHQIHHVFSQLTNFAGGDSIVARRPPSAGVRGLGPHEVLRGRERPQLWALLQRGGLR